MAYLRHGLVLLYQKACQKASIRARFSHNFLFREGLRLILGKPTESGSARLGHIPSLPWEPQLPLKPYLLLQPLNFKGNCDSLRFSPRFLLQFHSTVRFAPQMWATRPHLGSIFEKLLHRKTFCLPASRILQPNFYVAFMSCNVSRETLLLGKSPESGSARLGHIPSLPWESQLPLKPCISLQPSDYEGNCDAISIFLRFPLRFIKTFVKEGSLPSLTIHLAELSQLDRSSPTA